MSVADLAGFAATLRRERPEVLPLPGWASRRVAYELVLDEQGSPVSLLRLGERG